MNLGATVAFAAGSAHIMVPIRAERFPAEFLIVQLPCVFLLRFLDRVTLLKSQTVGIGSL
jgi:hypothetical protein